jgi:hypothetical protein
MASTKSKTSKPTSADSARKALNEIRNLQWQAQEIDSIARRGVDKARKALAEAEAHQAFIAGQLSKLPNATLAQARKVLDAKATDVELLKLVRACKQAPWAKLQRDGASDDQITTILKVGWPQYTYSDRQTRCEAEGPRVWIRNTSHAPTFSGKALIAEVRRVMEIPQPKATPAPKPPAKKKPDGGKKGPTGPALAEAKAPASPAPKAKSKAAKKPAAKVGAAAAADAHRAVVAKGGTLEEALDAGMKLLLVRPGQTYTPDQLGLADEDLEASMPPVELGGLAGNHPDDERGGNIGRPLTADGIKWAVIDASQQTGSITYTLQPLHTPDKPPAGVQIETWQKRRSRHANKPPEDVPLAGVNVFDRSSLTDWILGHDDRRIYCKVSKAAAGVIGDPAAWADTFDANVNEHGVYVRGIRTINVPGIAKSHKRTWAKIRVAKDADGYRAGHDFGLNYAGSSGDPSISSRAFASEAEAVRSVAESALQWFAGKRSHGAKAEKAAAIAAAAAVQDFLDHNPAAQPAAKKSGAAVVDRLISESEARVKKEGTTAWAKAEGFGDVSTVRAKKIASLPADKRHLMKDQRVNDAGEFTEFDGHLIRCDAGRIALCVVQDGSGRWHSGFKLHWESSRLTETYRAPTVEDGCGSRELALKVSSAWAEEEILKTNAGGSGHLATLDEQDVHAMREALKRARSKGFKDDTQPAKKLNGAGDSTLAAVAFA